MNRSGEFYPDYEHPSVAIIGAGLAGLACAIKIKEQLPDQQVTVIEKPIAQSNTQMAGQRYRHGIAGKRSDPVSEINELLTSRDSRTLTPEMTTFTTVALTELENWLARPGFVKHEDRPEWFGPQFGTASNSQHAGRGLDVLSYFRNEAHALGVNFIQGETTTIHEHGGHIDGLTTYIGGDNFMISAANYILANGSVGGSQYISTNRPISNNSHELAFAAGFDLVDSTIHMFHPFGKAGKHGQPKLGCFETDHLADAKVYLDGLSDSPIFDQETTELLRQHQAHYHMTEIAERFRRFGSVVRLEFPDSKTQYARVMHHYAHTGIRTDNGVKVSGVDNLFAVGDAANIGYWNSHQERFPGFALLKCLADSAFCLESLRAQDDPETTGLSVRPLIDSQPDRQTLDKQTMRTLQSINSRNLFNWIDADQDERIEKASAWVDELSGQDGNITGTLLDISIATADAHRKLDENTAHEPMVINKEIAEGIHNTPQPLQGVA